MTWDYETKEALYPLQPEKETRIYRYGFKNRKKNTSSNPAHYVLFCLYMHELQTLENSNYKTLVLFKIHVGFFQCICTK